MLKFKGYCAENRIKQAELADLLGLSVQSVNAKLNGRKPFSLQEAIFLCKHYGISMDHYFLPECCDNKTEGE